MKFSKSASILGAFLLLIFFAQNSYAWKFAWQEEIDGPWMVECNDGAVVNTGQGCIDDEVLASACADHGGVAGQGGSSTTEKPVTKK